MVLVNRKNVEDATVNSARYGKIGIVIGIVGVGLAILSILLQFS